MREAVNIPPIAKAATIADKATAVQFCVNSSELNVSSVIVGKKANHLDAVVVSVDSLNQTRIMAEIYHRVREGVNENRRPANWEIA